MKPLNALKVLMALATFIAVADTVPPPRPENGIRKITVPCSLCAKSPIGRGRLKLHPPDHGQHKGSINAKDHWDVKLTCPLCKHARRCSAMPYLRLDRSGEMPQMQGYRSHALYSKRMQKRLDNTQERDWQRQEQPSLQDVCRAVPDLPRCRPRNMS